MKRWRILSSTFTILVALSTSALILYTISSEPYETLRWFFLGPFSNLYFFGNMLASSVPLMFTGLAACLAFTAGLYNLGLEGQYYFGAIVGTFVALSVSVPKFLSIPLALTVSFLIGALLSLVPATLKLKFGFSELISSFIVGQIFIYFGDFLLNGPLRDPQAALSATKYLDEAIRLKKLLPSSNLHVGYLIAVFLCIVAQFMYQRSILGYEFRMVRGNARFAKIHGIDVRRIWLIAMLLSGGIAAFGGMIEVLGVHGRAVRGFSHGNGFNGIAVSLLVGNDPLLIFLSALFFAYLESGAEIASLMVQTPPEIVKFVHGIVFCLVTAEFFLRRRKLDVDATA